MNGSNIEESVDLHSRYVNRSRADKFMHSFLKRADCVSRSFAANTDLAGREAGLN